MIRTLFAWITCMVACAGTPPEPAKTVELGPPQHARTGRASEAMIHVQKGIARHIASVAAIDLRGTAYANDAVVFDALRKETDVDLPAMVLDAQGLTVEAAERRAGKKRPSCWYGNPKAHTSTDGLGATVDERYQTSTHLFLAARAALVTIDRAGAATGSYKMVEPLATMSIDLVEVTGNRRKTDVANAWRAAWKDILATPKGKGTSEGEGEAIAGSFVGYLGRLVPDAEYAAASKRMESLKSPDGALVGFRVADLAARSVLPLVMEQMEQGDTAKALRALDPIRSKETLATARAAVEKAVGTAKATSDRMQALCTIVGPTLAEPSPDAPPEDVERYLAVLDAAFAIALGVPKLEEEVRAFFDRLVATARGTSP